MYWITGLVGIILFFAPFLFGYTNETFAAWTSFIVGIIVASVSVMEWIRRGQDKWEYWTAEILGVAIVLAPFLLGFNNHVAATWTSVIAGVMLSLTAGTQLSVGKKE